MSRLATALLRRETTLTTTGSLLGAVILVGSAVLPPCQKVSVTSVDLAAVEVELAEATVSPGDTLRLRATPLDPSGNRVPNRPVV